jgi:hypothetical protein
VLLNTALLRPLQMAQYYIQAWWALIGALPCGACFAC